MIRFDLYAVSPPRGADWEYVVDDEPIRRAEPGNARLLADGHPAVRLAPDCAYRPWRNEYVLVHEDGSPPTLRVRATLWLRPKGLGADVLDFEARLEDPFGGGSAAVMVPSALLRRAGLKLAKVLEWYRAERSRRERRHPRMLTAFELWTGEERSATAS